MSDTEKLAKQLRSIGIAAHRTTGEHGYLYVAWNKASPGVRHSWRCIARHVEGILKARKK